MAKKGTAKKVWRKAVGAHKQDPAEVVLSRCGDDSYPGLHCWRSDSGAVELAVFLESPAGHSEGAARSPEQARVKLAYRSYHPKPFTFTRSYECVGGKIAEHDPAEKFEIVAGKTEGRAFRTEVVPDGVTVDRGANGAQIKAALDFGKGKPALNGDDPVKLAVSFPSGRTLRCACCGG